MSPTWRSEVFPDQKLPDLFAIDQKFSTIFFFFLPKPFLNAGKSTKRRVGHLYFPDLTCYSIRNSHFQNNKINPKVGRKRK